MKKNIKRFAILMIFATISFLGIASQVSAANDLTKSDLIDSIQISPKDLRHGDRASISVIFSEKENVKIKKDDTITLKLPNVDGAKLIGFEVTKKLTSNNVTLGYLTVKDDTITVTFTKECEELENVKGDFKFDIRAWNERGDTDYENIAELNTNFGTKLDSQDVVIERSAPGNSGQKYPFYYKTGDISTSDTNHLLWYLVINNDKYDVNGPVKIIDKVGAGQKLDVESFVFFINGHKLSTKQFIDGGYGNITFDGNNFEVNIFDASNTSIDINYTTTITDTSLEKFENNTNAWYQASDGMDVSDGKAFNSSIKNLSFQGDISGTIPKKGSVRVAKKLHSTNEALKDIVFDLYNSNDQLVGTITTDEHGVADYDGLEPDIYYLKERATFEHLDINPDKKYTFEIKEGMAEGVLLEVKNSIKTTDISANKVWVNGPKVKPAVSLELLQNGTPYGDPVVLKDGETNYTWKDLPKYDVNGNLLKYTVDESSVPDGFDKEISNDGLTITNKAKPTQISASKVWVGGSKIKPDVTLTLFQNDKATDKQVVLKNGDTSHTFTDLPKYDDNGYEYKYTVDELEVPTEYNKRISSDGLTITNTAKPIEVTGTKKWVGASAVKPDIKLVLVENDKITDKVVTLKDGEDKYTWNDLPKYDNDGKIIDYSVDELNTPKEYTKEISLDKLTITNKAKPIEVTGTKKWIGASSVKPDIKLVLVENNKATDKEVTLKNGEENYTWKDLPKYDNDGKVIDYSIDELDTPKEYTKEISNDGLTITNKIIPIEVTGTKKWVGGPAVKPTIKLVLVKNDELTNEEVTLKDDVENYTWKNLPKYDKDGKLIDYSIEELNVPKEYTKEVSDDGLTITNTVTPTQFTGKKVWVGGPAIKPNIALALIGNKKTRINTKILKNGETTHTWKDLPRYDQEGNLINYSVDELDVNSEYTKTISPDGKVVTNTIKSTNIVGKKVWNGGPAVKPDISLVLKRNDEVIGDKIILQDGELSHEWKDLPRYSDLGEKYTYKVDEVNVPNEYTKSISPDGLTVTNTINPTQITGTKVWVGGPTIKPEIKLVLKQNNQQIGDKATLSDGELSHTWDNLDRYDSAGKAYEYSIDEVDVPEEYSKSISNDGLTVFNTIKSIEVTGTKKWVNAPKIKPNINLVLVKNGKPQKDKVTLVNGELTHTWSNLTKYDDEGKEIKYSIDEVDLPKGYNKVISKDGLTITNTKEKTPSNPKSNHKISKKGNENNDNGNLPTTGNINISSIVALAVLSLTGSALYIKRRYQ